MAQAIPYAVLKEAPREIRQAATIALICTSFTRALGILVTTVIIATLPTWVPGLLAYQPFPIALILVAIGCHIVAGKGSRAREAIASREFEKARGSSLSAVILGFTIAGVIPGILYILLYARIGSAMVKRRPDDPKTIYLLPRPSEGLFLGRYLGWAASYLFILYVGYTQLPPGLAGVSGWLSPVFGVHLNTLIVAIYLVFTNPLTYPPLFQLWLTAGIIGGLIAGGKVGRGFMVGFAVFFSTLGAMGLAALSIFQGLTSGSFPSIPPPPPGFSLISMATGPVASDILPLFLQASSPTDPAFVESVTLTLARNAGLIFTIVTISGRAASLAWQGAVDVGKFVFVLARGRPGLKTDHSILERPVLKTAIILLMLLPLLAVPTPPHSSSIQNASIPSLYEQRLAVGLDMLGAPNASLQMVNLDLSSHGLVMDNSYAGAGIAAFIINNDDSQALGNGQQSEVFQVVSEPALVTYYSGSPSVTSAESTAVESQFSRALGVQFTTIFSLPMGQGTATIYAPNPEMSNQDALTRLLGLLPSQSFSSLINPANLQNAKYFAAIGLVPLTYNGVTINALSFFMNIQWPRQYYKAGISQIGLKSLLGFPNDISGDPAANVSLVSLSFQRGTVLYSPLFPNPYYDNTTSTYYLNVTSGSSPDLVAKFAYPFAPNIVIEKTVTPSSGPVGATHAVVVSVRNLDNVTVTNLTVSDPEATPAYMQTMQASPSGTQSSQSPLFASGNSMTMSYTLKASSSGTYVLSPSKVNFTWTAPNGSRIPYTINSSPTQFTSLSGPRTQFTRTFDDLQPYSLLLLIPLLLTPVVETYRLYRRRGERRRDRELISTPSASQPESTSSKTVQAGSGSSNPLAS